MKPKKKKQTTLPRNIDEMHELPIAEPVFARHETKHRVEIIRAATLEELQEKTNQWLDEQHAKASTTCIHQITYEADYMIFIYYTISVLEI